MADADKCAHCYAIVSHGVPVCATCRASTTADLEDLARLGREVEITLTRQGHRGVDVGVRNVGGNRPMPFDVHAARWMTAFRAWAGTWSSRTPPVWVANAIAHPHAYAAVCGRVWEAHLLGRADVGDFIRQTCKLAADGTRLIDLPPERFYIGVCSSGIPTADEELICDRDLYAREGKGTVTCPQCLAVHDVAERRAALLVAVEDTLATAYEISRAVHLIDHPLTPAAITNHHHRGRLPRRGVNANGDHLYRVGDVIDLAASLAARRGVQK